MNTTDWHRYFSLSPDKINPAYPGALYEPLLNETEDILCMNFNNTDYRPFAANEDLLNACFTREVKYLHLFQKYPWCADLLEVDKSNRRVFISWNTRCCEKIIREGDNLEDYCPTWKQQLEKISSDIKQEQVYKISMYPCYFYIDKKNQLRAFGFYTTCDYIEQPIAIDLYRPILNAERSKFIDTISVDGKVDFSILNRHSFTSYIKWPDDPMPEIYRKVYQSQ